MKKQCTSQNLLSDYFCDSYFGAKFNMLMSPVASCSLGKVLFPIFIKLLNKHFLMLFNVVKVRLVGK